MRFVRSDDGRSASGFDGPGGCVCSAFSIASGRPYREIYELLEQIPISLGRPDGGIYADARACQQLMRRLGFRLVRTRFHRRILRLRSSDLPLGRLVVLIHGHAAAVIDRTLYDHTDLSRNGEALIYAYYIYQGPPILGRPPKLRWSRRGIVAMLDALTEDMTREIIEHQYGYSDECLQEALEIVLTRWRNVDPRRWQLALKRALVRVQRIANQPEHEE
jgi:hypothetical protein